jgi:glycosyltransferase involved in cell wall biosynthesis
MSANSVGGSMRIAVLVGTSSKLSGGSHSYSKLLVEGILSSDLKEKAEIIFLSGYQVLDQAELLKPGSSRKKDGPPILSLKLFRRFLEMIQSHLKKSNLLLEIHRWIRTMNLNRILAKHEIDFVWSLFPLSAPLNTPYAMPVWDLQHRLQPYWPEVSRNGQWRLREKAFSSAIRRATYIIVGTHEGANEVSFFYGFSQKNILIAPFPVKASIPFNQTRDRNLIFYPAQFWPHKNHINLILGFKKILDIEKSNLKLVLPGNDMGNLEYVRSAVKDLGLEENVMFPGFISDDELSLLYQTAGLMIFPSYFGPDNIPPLEAISNSCPTAVAEVSGAREQFGDSVFYFNPDSPQDISDVISRARLLDPIDGFAKMKPGFDFDRKSPLSIAKGIGDEILQFQSKRHNWK